MTYPNDRMDDMENEITAERMAEIEREMAEEDARVMALRWEDLPRGHYAVTVQNLADDEGDFELIGYVFMERQAPRETKTGRIIGHHRFRTSYAGVSPYNSTDVATYLEREAVDLWGSRKRQTQMQIGECIWRPEEARKLFGVVTGHCAWCGKELTDAESKMRGIGPACFEALGL